MRRTALILAGAAAFGLSIMAVAAEAQQQTRPPPVRIPTTTTGPTFPGTADGAAVRDPTGTGGCTPGSPVPGGTGNPCASAAYPPFHYEYLPHGRECMSHIPVSEPQICLRRRSGFIASCTGSGGTIQHENARTVCVLPSNEIPRLERSLTRSGVARTLPATPLGNVRPGASPPRN